MTFYDMLAAAKNGDPGCIEGLIDMYSPLLFRASVVDGSFDEDLLQELKIVLLACIQTFSM